VGTVVIVSRDGKLSERQPLTDTVKVEIIL